ncbi:MAG: sensor histidine kinase [Dissulfurispiraceae bacterium]|jgi:PAS domain S-box-containing protein
MTEPFSDKQQLKAFINAAQYIAGLTSSQDIWEEAGKVLLRFFGADFVAFGRYDADGNIEIGRRLFSGDSASVLLLEQELKTAARDVFDSGFLTFLSLPSDKLNTVALFPVLHQNRVVAVMIVGHLSSSCLEKDILDLYLAMAGLMGSAYSRNVAAMDVFQAKEDWERTFETVPDMIALMDLEYRIVRANKALTAGLGLTSEQCAGNTCQSVFCCAGEVPIYCPFTKLLADGMEHTAEIHVDRIHRDFFVSVSPLHDKDGKLVGGVYVARDITERKRAEDEIRRLNEELEERVLERTSQLTAANQELEAFAYSVSHDLRAPLRHMAGFAKLLQKRIECQPDEKNIHYANMIEGAAKKMGMLINDLLSFSRTGRVEILKVEFSLKGLIIDSIREMGTETGGRCISWDIGELPNVCGDPSLLKLVCNNLFSNAVKFTRNRPRTVIRIDCKEDGDDFVFSVKDNGVGFDMKHVDRLFGVFQRLHHQDEFEGTGIGLANVRRIISRHGGKTWAEASPEEGASFYFTLPKTKKD